MMRRQSQHQQQQSRVFNDLSSLCYSLLRWPPSPIELLSDDLCASAPAPRRTLALPPLTPSGFASLMLGISLALMLCGSVTFFIGFMLMPWVLGLVMVFYFVGLVSSISVLGRSILCYATSAAAAKPPQSRMPSSPRKDVHSWRFT